MNVPEKHVANYRWASIEPLATWSHGKLICDSLLTPLTSSIFCCECLRQHHHHCRAVTRFISLPFHRKGTRLYHFYYTVWTGTVSLMLSKLIPLSLFLYSTRIGWRLSLFLKSATVCVCLSSRKKEKTRRKRLGDTSKGKQERNWLQFFCLALGNRLRSTWLHDCRLRQRRRWWWWRKKRGKQCRHADSQTNRQTTSTRNWSEKEREGKPVHSSTSLQANISAP